MAGLFVLAPPLVSCGAIGVATTAPNLLPGCRETAIAQKPQPLFPNGFACSCCVIAPQQPAQLA